MDYFNPVQLVQQQAMLNNSWSAAQAQKQMDFQERMSNTAHQREVADLKAAGLNPVLSANSGASTPNGAQGTVDTSITSALLEAMEKFGAGLGSGVSGFGDGHSASGADANDLVTELTERGSTIVKDMPRKYRWLGQTALQVLDYGNQHGWFSDENVNSAYQSLENFGKKVETFDKRATDNRQNIKDSYYVAKGKANYAYAKGKYAINSAKTAINNAVQSVKDSKAYKVLTWNPFKK